MKGKTQNHLKFAEVKTTVLYSVEEKKKILVPVKPYQIYPIHRMRE